MHTVRPKVPCPHCALLNGAANTRCHACGRPLHDLNPYFAEPYETLYQRELTRHEEPASPFEKLQKWMPPFSDQGEAVMLFVACFIVILALIAIELVLACL